MIRGLSSDYSGRIYIYYRGPQRVVLTEAHDGFKPMDGDMATTSLRVVLNPNSWTECNFGEQLKAAFNDHRGRLYHLEKDGYVDIYTDKAEVEAVKQGKSFAEAHVVQEAVVQQTPPVQQKQYFNMQMFTSNQPQQSQPSALPANSALDPVSDALKTQQELMQKQMEAMLKMTESLNTMINKVNEKLDKGN